MLYWLTQHLLTCALADGGDSEIWLALSIGTKSSLKRASKLSRSFDPLALSKLAVLNSGRGDHSKYINGDNGPGITHEESNCGNC